MPLIMSQLLATLGQEIGFGYGKKSHWQRFFFRENHGSAGDLVVNAVQHFEPINPLVFGVL